MVRVLDDVRTSGTTWRSAALVAADVVALYAASVAAYELRALEDKPLLEYASIGSFAETMLALVPAWVVLFAACGLYTTRQSYGRASEVGRLLVAVGLGVTSLVLVDYFTLGAPLFPGRKVPVYAFLLGVAAVLLGRSLVRLVLQQVYARDRGLHNVAVVGSGPLAERIVAELGRPGRGTRVIAAVSVRDAGSLLLGRVPVYSTVEQVLQSHRVPVHEIVHVDPDASRDEAARLMALATARGMGYRFVPDMYGVFAAGSVMSTVAGIPLMEVRLTTLDGWGAVGKRLVDAVGAAVGLFLLAPLFLAVGLAVKLTDPTGPVFYRQERLGRGGRPIGVLKFRTMRWEYSTGPDRPYRTAVEAFEAMGRADLVPEFLVAQKVADDPRVSGLGAFLRRTSLDELPQLVNALRGDLSLVGPRPITVGELERYGPRRDSFLALKPGITGLWQVSGRSDTGYDERVALDVFYVENWSHWLDLSILARTVVTVAARRGAY
ncbi:sugar transferase [Microlunatus capsulatus]|uniref:Exopolysaccharide biosynthesis polyprenyl glycosylphosphotransferase n=1 Tax=Microlunatus capsulatus TaxID=99117 RepID=A0ABS4Z4M4_9ACTN|nr:sugar transferase [Microlunatus capsulatus]MBP2415919.1 exopolysaccharide biosynthesis polyprenyl glycosylphosphotransferase [Microlunatus capsulatus]